MMKLHSKKTLYFILALDLMIVGSFSLVYKYKQKYIVNIRQAWFSSVTSNDDIYMASPEELINVYGFKTEPSQLKKEFYSAIESVKYVQNNRVNIESQKNEIKKARSIILLFQKEEKDKQADFSSLLEKIRTLPAADVYGDCSDNSEVFVTLGSFFGLTVRQVHNTVHVFSEIYSRDLSKWIWFDPGNAIMARNDKGEYLSLIEMTRLYNNNKKIDFELFGKNEYPEMKKNYFYNYYDNKEKFSYVMMTLGNNFYEVDRYGNQMRYLPKFLREFIMLIGNIHPHYVIYSSNRDEIIKWSFIKYASIISVSGIILMNIAVVPIMYYQKFPKKALNKCENIVRI